MPSLARRRALLTAALGFTQLLWREPVPPSAVALVSYMDSWAGIGATIVGMARQGYDVQLTEYGGENWRATFYTTGMAHSIVKGSAYEPTCAGAVQRAAWAAVKDQREHAK